MQSTISSPTLKKGSVGAKVKELQQMLNKIVTLEYRLVVDGIFGPKTEAIVKLSQFFYFLQEDGIVGPKTWKALYAGAPVDMPILSRGSEGPLVKEVQEALNGLNPNRLVVDGIFGPKTEAAIKDLQKNSSTEVDRNGKIIVGPKTWKALSSSRVYAKFG